MQVNGELGIRTPATEATPAGIGVLAVRDGRIAAVYQVVNPEKLAHLPG